MADMKRFFIKLWRNFLAGLLIVLPITITILVLIFLYRWIVVSVMDWIRPVIFLISPEGVDEILKRYIWFWDILAFLLLVLAIAIIGVIARSSIVARWLIRSGEEFLARLPLINKIYSATRQVSQAILGEKRSNFTGVVLLEYPRRGLWCIGLVSGVAAGEVQKKTEDKVIGVFLPTTPNPTSGLFVLMPEKDAIPLKMSIEEALTMIVSGGVVTPPFEDDLKTENNSKKTGSA
jgi:uncharacterized membrane protein